MSGNRFTIEFSPEQMGELEEVRKAFRAADTSDAIRKALGLASYAAEVVKRGDRLAVVDAEDDLRLIVNLAEWRG